MSTVLVGISGAAVTRLLMLAARRFAVVDRVRPLGAPTRVLPTAVRVRLERALAQAGLGVSPEHAAQIAALAAMSAAVVGVAMAPAIGFAAPVAVLVGGIAWLRAARHRQARVVAAALPAALDVIAAELRAGGTVSTGIARVAHGDGPLAGDMDRVEARVRLGASLSAALSGWVRERRVAGAESVAGALALAGQVGGRCAGALEGLAASLRERLSVVAEARALAAQARYSALVMIIGPLGYLALSAVLDPRSVHALVATSAGRTCAVIGLLFEGAGALWMRRILAGIDR